MTAGATTCLQVVAWRLHLAPTMRPRLVIMMFAATAGAMAVLGAHASPIIIYNPSDSVPRGFYARTMDTPRIGDFVTVRAVDVAPAYATVRGFTDATDHFIKRIAATRGQVVCSHGGILSIDGTVVARGLENDAMGRSLPSWSGCKTLAANELLLLGDTSDSFDGRCWGPT